MKAAKIIIACLLINSIFKLMADTEIGGNIQEDTVLTLANSPYLVTSSISLFPDVTLTIEPGVVIKFQNYKQLTIGGTILAIGNVDDPITFTSSSSNPQPDSWQGIEFETEYGGKGEFRYVIGKYAENLIDLVESSNPDSLRFNNCHFYNNDYCFSGLNTSNGYYQTHFDSCLVEDNSYGFIYSSNLLVTNSVIRNNTKAFHGWDGPSIAVHNSEISGNEIWGFNMSGEISDCVIKNNGLGLRLRDDLILTNNIIQNNDTGIEITSYDHTYNTNVLNNCISYNDINVLHTDSDDIDLANNCWGTYDITEIANSIYDGNDDFTLGIITFEPILEHCLLDTHLTVSPHQITLLPEEGVFEILVQANSDWQVIENSDWLFADPETGVNSDTVMINYEANPNGYERNTTITVICQDHSEDITVTQAGVDPELQVMPDNHDVEAASGSVSYDILSNLIWNCSTNVNWLTITPGNGTNNGTIMVEYEENPTIETRIAEILIDGNSLSETVTLTQTGADPVLYVLPDTQEVNANAGTTSFLINANMDWTVNYSDDWISVFPTNGSLTDSIIVNFEANPAVDMRSTSLVIAGYELADTVTVVQTGADPLLNVTPDLQQVSSLAGTTFFEITANIAWTVTYEADWLLVEPVNGIYNDSLLVQYDANPSAESRSADIIVSGESFTETVSIIQSGNTASPDDSYIPEQTMILGNYPNPFNPLTLISYQLAEETFVNLHIFDIRGKCIETLVSKKQPLGTYYIPWDGSKYSSGIYFYSLVTKDYSIVKKMLMVK